MADQPGSPAESAPATAPAPAPAPAPVTTPPPEPVKEPASTQDALDPNMVVTYTGKDGVDKYKTLAELVSDAEAASSVQIDEETRQIAELFKKSKSDKSALGELMKKIAPDAFGQAPAPDQPTTPEQQAIEELRKQNLYLNEQLQTVAPTVEQIKTMQNANQIQTIIQQQADKLPLTARNAQGAQMVMAKFAEKCQIAEASGNSMDAQSQSVQLTALAQSMREVENGLQYMLSQYGVDPANMAQQGLQQNQQAGAVDDQVRQKAEEQQSGYVKPRISFKNGQMVDTEGRPMVQNQLGRIVPLEMPNAPAGGATVGGAEEAPTGPINSMDKLVNRMKALRQEKFG